VDVLHVVAYFYAREIAVKRICVAASYLLWVALLHASALSQINILLTGKWIWRFSCILVL